MIDLLFVVLAFAYLALGTKVDEWVTISMLGFKLETPAPFLTHQNYYDLVRRLFLAGAIFSLMGVTTFHWFWGLGILAIAWFMTTWLGQRRAFSKYRRIWREGIDEAKTQEDRAFRLSESNKTNSELRDQILGYRNLVNR